MSIHIAVHHATRYQYDRLVSIAPHVFRLRPAPHSRTPIISYSLRIEPAEHFINWQQDPFGNYLARVVFPQQARTLSVEVDLVANMTVINPFDFFLDDKSDHYPFDYEPQLRKDLMPYLEQEQAGPRLHQWLAGADRGKKQIIDFLVEINQRLRRDIDYAVRMEPGVQSCEDTLEKALGSCRDSGWLLVQILRHMGLAARFVSGYLVQLTADEKSLDGPSGPERDFTDLHAWAEVYIPGAGWIGLDPTSGLFAGEGHIPLACTPDPQSAAPVTGATDPCEVEFSFSNEVRRVHEDPRVTKPYSEAQWAAVEALGAQVDADLAAGDVRLTMGGEPTFVSIDDMDSVEWDTAADGEGKRRLAGDLLRRLHRAFAPGGLLHYGQGKWYPGEQLPRWQYGCYWRKDGEPLWRDAKLLADLSGEGETEPEDARNFIADLATGLAVNPEHALAAYEDVFYYLWREGTLPDGIDPLAADLKDSLERQYLARLLDRDMGAPAGYVLPLRWNLTRARWESGTWTFRRGHLFLTPGGSAMGLRLPLDSLPKAAEAESHYERSPLAPRPPLAAGERSPGGQAAVGEVVQTALCAEVRDGHLHLFLPPLPHLEHYVELIAAIEEVAQKRARPVVIEGYEPPHDERLSQLKVTPDPGVIEVNVHPSSSWQEVVKTTTTLYEEARAARLGTEKFMLDGRHTGTGGGNHVTIGGPTPGDSPILRRPELLQSLITYWQHHPALSYLFSGLFIGPTSQAPRADEGRDEALYELEIAFEQMPTGETQTPWLADRLLRHLLVDLTGNTHRAEFCIDKLYSPDSQAGRLGLLEFRAFEMPPHARMSLVQMLLLRALVAHFWHKPYKHRLVRWGTELHDRFMLPHYVRADMEDVVADLQRAGYDFRMEYFDPFIEFRFPRYGTVRIRDIEI